MASLFLRTDSSVLEDMLSFSSDLIMLKIALFKISFSEKTSSFLTLPNIQSSFRVYSLIIIATFFKKVIGLKTIYTNFHIKFKKISFVFLGKQCIMSMYFNKIRLFEWHTFDLNKM